MSKVSIIIPSCNEIFLQQTIDSILKAAAGDIEIIAVLDGYWPQPAIKDDPRVTLIHEPVRMGMRHGINAAARIARGEYLCKMDGHCLPGPSFDEVLKADCDDDWIVTPRRYSLDAEKWAIEENGKIRDAHYLSYPTAYGPETYLGFGMHVKDWYARGDARKDVMIDDEMISQGSCWLMKRAYFTRLGGLPEEGYGTFIQESQQLMLRAWLTGGQVKVNKNAWYAHLWKGKKWGRMYDLSRAESKCGEIYSADFWFNNRLANRVHDLGWLIDKFWPVPTWPENWRDLKVEFPAPPAITVSVPDIVISPPPIASPAIVRPPRTRDDVVDYLLKKFGIGKIKSLPIEIDLNRSEWGKLFCELGYRVGAEIGVYAGQYSEVLCRDNPGVVHICVDPWVAYPEYVNHRRQSGLCCAEDEAHQRLDKYGCRFVKKFSMEAVKEIADKSLDYVYIDGNHDFQNVTNDICEWEKKVRPGGIVAGHDYDKHLFRSKCHVLQVVRGYTEAVGIYPWFIMSNKCKTNDTDGNARTSFFWVKS